MRLAFVIESNTDRRLIEGLAARYELTLISRSRRVAEFAAQPETPVRHVIGPASRLRFAFWLLRRLRGGSGGADAVLAQGYGPAALGANLAMRLGGSPVTMLVCNPAERYYECRRTSSDPSSFRRAEYGAIVALGRLNARLGRRHAVLSRHLEAIIRSQGARGVVRVAPVYGVDPDVFYSDRGDREAQRGLLGVGDETALIFFASRLAPEKDGATVLAAVARLVADGRDVRLIIRARDHRDLLHAAGGHGIAGALLAGDMVDPGPELASLYRASDVVVQASRQEGLGFAPLEALACGTAVVASAVGGLLETIVPGETGWSCPVGDDAAMAACIAEVIDQPEEARRRTQRGAALVRREFTTGRAFEELAQVLQAR